MPKPSPSLLWLCKQAKGCYAEVEMNDGTVLSGLVEKVDFETMKIQLRYVWICVSSVEDGRQRINSPVVKPKDKSTISISEVALLRIKDVDTPKPGDALTDAAIGAMSGDTGRERVLVPFIADTGVAVDLDTAPVDPEWNQFEANSRLLGKQAAELDLNEYSTKLDTDSDFYREHRAEAARLAREIEGRGSTNRHIREERGQVALTEVGEEEAYSSVLRDTPAPASAPAPAAVSKFKDIKAKTTGSVWDQVGKSSVRNPGINIPKSSTVPPHAPASTTPPGSSKPPTKVPTKSKSPPIPTKAATPTPTNATAPTPTKAPNATAPVSAPKPEKPKPARSAKTNPAAAREGKAHTHPTSTAPTPPTPSAVEKKEGATPSPAPVTSSPATAESKAEPKTPKPDTASTTVVATPSSAEKKKSKLNPNAGEWVPLAFKQPAPLMQMHPMLPQMLPGMYMEGGVPMEMGYMPQPDPMMMHPGMHPMHHPHPHTMGYPPGHYPHMAYGPHPGMGYPLPPHLQSPPPPHSQPHGHHSPTPPPPNQRGPSPNQQSPGGGYPPQHGHPHGHPHPYPHQP